VVGCTLTDPMKSCEGHHSLFRTTGRLLLTALALAVCSSQASRGSNNATLAVESSSEPHGHVAAKINKRSVRSHAAAMTAIGSVLRSKKGNGTRGHEHRHHGTRISGASPPESQRRPLAVDRLPAEPEQFYSDDNELMADLVSADDKSNVTKKDMLIDLVGGTGATIGGTGNLEIDRDLVRRMRYQDKAVMLLLLLMYFLVLGFSASFAYRQALNDSPISFYADPRFHDMAAEGSDQQLFLDAFTQAPKDVHLQISGFVPVPPGGLGSIEWNGEYYYDAFSFSLDLSPWVKRSGNRSVPESEGLALVEGVVSADLDVLQDFIEHNHNDLALVQVEKEVEWVDWEELATNIKLRIRQCGFTGVISIHRTAGPTVTVYKNAAWANFMHSRITKILCALSVLGWFVYLPYMWLRCTSTVIRTRYTVDISIKNYWDLISDKLSADGFTEDPRVPEQLSADGFTEDPRVLDELSDDDS